MASAEAISADSFPFLEAAASAQTEEWGVLKITNIPYNVSKQEIYNLLGPNSNIISPAIGDAFHITMDRISAKTLDCFVEFYSHVDAQATYNQFARLQDEGKTVRLQHRHVEILMSSQTALMGALFPRAKNIQWTGQKPVNVESNEPFNSGFKSFLLREELVMLVKFAEQPHRFGFTQKCPYRTYESLISILYKFPWSFTSMYTLTHRDQLYDALLKMIKVLMFNLGPGGPQTLPGNLLEQLVHAGVRAPGFSERQKWGLMMFSGFNPDQFNISPQSRTWPFQTLGRKADAEEDTLKRFAQIINTGALPDHIPHTARSLLAADQTFNPNFFTWYPSSPDMTMAECAQKEWQILDGLVRRAFDPSTAGSAAENVTGTTG